MAIPTTNVSMKDVYNVLSNSATTTTPYSLSKAITGDTDDGIFVNSFSLHKPFNLHTDNITPNPFDYPDYFVHGLECVVKPRYSGGGGGSQNPGGGAILISIHPAYLLKNAYEHALGIEYGNLETINMDKVKYLYNLFGKDINENLTNAYFILESTINVKEMFSNGTWNTTKDWKYIHIRTFSGTTYEASFVENTNDELKYDYTSTYLYGFSIDRLIQLGKSYSINGLCDLLKPDNWKNYFFYFKPSGFSEIKNDESGNTVYVYSCNEIPLRLGDFRGYNKNASSFGRIITITKQSGNRFGYTASILSETNSNQNGECLFSKLAYNVLLSGGTDTYNTYFVDEVNGNYTNTLVNQNSLSESNISSSVSTPFTASTNGIMQKHNNYFIFTSQDCKIGLPNFTYECAGYDNQGFFGEKYSYYTWFQPYPYIDAKSTSGNSSYISVEASSAPYVDIDNYSRTFNVTFKHQLPATLTVPSWLTASRNSLPDYTTGETSGETTVTFTATTNTTDRTGSITLVNTQYALNGYISIIQTYKPRNIIVRVLNISKVSSQNYSVAFQIENITTHPDSVNYEIFFVQHSDNGASSKFVTGSVSLSPLGNTTTGVNLTCDAGYTSISNATFVTNYFEADSVTYAGTYLTSSGQIILP